MTDDPLTRWRLILGQDSQAMREVSLNEQQSLLDATLAALYDDTDGKGKALLNCFLSPKLSKM